jgi:hypothetical protein
LLDDGILREIQACSVEFAASTGVDFSLTLTDLEAFMGLLYLKGARNNKNFPYELLWSMEIGCQQSQRVMSRDRFVEIKKNIRFNAPPASHRE